MSKKTVIASRSAPQPAGRFAMTVYFEAFRQSAPLLRYLQGVSKGGSEDDVKQSTQPGSLPLLAVWGVRGPYGRSSAVSLPTFLSAQESRALGRVRQSTYRRSNPLRFSNIFLFRLSGFISTFNRCTAEATCHPERNVAKRSEGEGSSQL